MREGGISSCLAGAVLLFPNTGREVARGHSTGKMSPWAGTMPGPACCEGKAGFVPSVIIWFHGAPLFAFFFLNLPRIWWHHCPHRGVFTARPSCDCPPCLLQWKEGTLHHKIQCLLVAPCLLPALGKDGGIASTRSPQAHEAGGCTNTPGLTGFKELA